MVLYLMWKDKRIACLDSDISLSGMHVRHADILIPALLPDGLRGIHLTGQQTRAACLDHWFRRRTIPDSRINLEPAMIQLYQIKLTWGRAYGMQQTAALLCHFMSMEDDYWINPSRTEAVCHVYEEPYFDSLYLLRQSSYQHLLDLRENPDSDTGKVLTGAKLSLDHFDGLDMTIHTDAPARWCKVEGKIMLTGADGKALPPRDRRCRGGKI